MAKIVKKQTINVLVFWLIFSMVVFWLFSGWPFPPEIKEAQAGETTNNPGNDSGGWTNPTNAYNDDVDGYASVTSGMPSASHTYGNYGFSLTGNTITKVQVRYDAWSTYSTVTFRAAGAGTKGTGAVTPALPTGIAAGDIAILVATTIAGGSVSITADGSITPWTAITGSPVDVTGGEKLYVWWGRYSSGSTGPTVTPGGDHITASVTAWYNCIASGSPIDVQETGTETTSDTDLSFATTISTSVNGAMVILVSSTGADKSTAQHSAQDNTNLSSIAEGQDYNANTGDGGGFEVVEGYLANAGEIGTWIATLATASPKAYITFALKPDPANEQIRVDVSCNSGADWSSKQTTGLSGTETTYWYDVTEVAPCTPWTPEKLNNTNFQVRVDAVTVGVSGEVRLDWIPVEVTYTPPPEASITVADLSVDYLVVPLNSSQNTTASGVNETQFANNTGTAAENFWIKSYDAFRTGGNTWFLASSPDSNYFNHTASIDGGSTWNIPMIAANTYYLLKENVAINETVNVDLKIGMPTDTNDPWQHTIAVTIMAEIYGP